MLLRGMLTSENRSKAMRQVVVRCDGGCGLELKLDLKAEKAEGGFYACDIKYELNDSGWVSTEDCDFCQKCVVRRT